MTGHLRATTRLGQQLLAHAVGSLELRSTRFSTADTRQFFDQLHLLYYEEPLHEGLVLRAAGMPLILVREGDVLRLRQPEVRAPGQHTYCLDDTLELFRLQFPYFRMRSRGIHVAPPEVDSLLVGTPGVFEARRLRMSRRPPEQPDHSGWYLEQDDPSPAGTGGEQERLSIREAYLRRPLLVAPLPLPEGWTVIVNGDTIESYERGPGAK